jgi:hypothetical protein
VSFAVTDVLPGNRFCAKFLRGTPSGKLPVEWPTKRVLSTNPEPRKTLGIMVPSRLLGIAKREPNDARRHAATPAKTRAVSNAKREHHHGGNAEYQHRKGYRIVFEPMDFLYAHDATFLLAPLPFY